MLGLGKGSLLLFGRGLLLYRGDDGDYGRCGRLRRRFGQLIGLARVALDLGFRLLHSLCLHGGNKRLGFGFLLLFLFRFLGGCRRLFLRLLGCRGSFLLRLFRGGCRFLGRFLIRGFLLLFRHKAQGNDILKEGLRRAVLRHGGGGLLRRRRVSPRQCRCFLVGKGRGNRLFRKRRVRQGKRLLRKRGVLRNRGILRRQRLRAGHLRRDLILKVKDVVTLDRFFLILCHNQTSSRAQCAVYFIISYFYTIATDYLALRSKH